MKIPSKRRLIAAAGVGLLLILGVAVLQTVRHRAHTAGQAQGQYYCPMHPTYTSDRPGDCPICSMRLVRRETTAAAPAPEGSALEDICVLHNCPRLHEGRPCPMLVVSRPGESVTCPVCGTHVVPEGEQARAGVPSAGPSGYSAVLLSPQKRQLIGVKTAPVERRKLIRTIRTVGRVMVDETRVVHVHPKVEGWVREIFARYEGDAVRKGQPLFSFYSPDFIAVQQEYLTARSMEAQLPTDAAPELAASARANREAARQRLLWWDITEDQIRALEERGIPSETLLLVSPMDGVVLRKHVWSGEFMERGGDFYHIADLSTIWVDADLYEQDLPHVSVGQEAVVTLSQAGQAPFRGEVVYVSPVVNMETRTATARLEFPNADGVLRPGQYATAEISVDLGERLVVPAQAVQDTGARRILFVSKGDGLLEPREVRVGARAGDDVEILHGVSEGEQVVTSGNFLIDSESRLKAALDGMASAEPGEAPHRHGP
ncbi:MAG: efflux RND transporter periplasmic adaptor subunit [Candidatus Omnitrophica bacterium]|nr:efflux RND transporter periplasmic adaptor subunit [Candidatus Omnitrophota bacterium]